MFIKYVLFLVIVSVIYAQVVLGAPNKYKRDVPTADDTGKAIGDLIEGFKNNADAILKNIQESAVYKDMSDALTKFGNALQTEASRIVEKAKNSD